MLESLWDSVYFNLTKNFEHVMTPQREIGINY